MYAYLIVKVLTMKTLSHVTCFSVFKNLVAHNCLLSTCVHAHGIISVMCAWQEAHAVMKFLHLMLLSVHLISTLT